MNLKTAINNFWADEDGAVMSLGLLFAVPILVWALLSTFVYLDLFRTELIANKAGITLADMISREENPITDDYIDGAVELLELLTEADDAPDLRVTVVWYDEDADALEVSWSEHRGYDAPYTTADMTTLRNRIPIMGNFDRAIIVETRTDYSQPISYSMGPFTGADLNDVEFNTFTVIKPRFTPNFCFDEIPSSDTNVMDC
ncbi:hypothetical protein [Yoonia sp. BS5-3]|uniref:Flp pilus-assembly TadG-like N-terminal domain-containing protein n=1 Tax=Yoonia phaeophyticola TaxID=3137369 RepID=A0ABZ2V204_9RHOB